MRKPKIFHSHREQKAFTIDAWTDGYFCEGCHRNCGRRAGCRSNSRLRSWKYNRKTQYRGVFK